MGQAAATALARGARVGRYTIDSLLGAGGMSVVYKAHAEGSSTPVALKLLHRHHVPDAQVSRRFEREARLLRELQGEHVVSVLDAGTFDDGRPFMALTFIDGDPLDVWLGRHGAPPLASAVRWAIDICGALELCHQQRVVHRDLKPANILLERVVTDGAQRPAESEGVTPSPTGDDHRRVRVCDFGLGKALHPPEQAMTALTEGNVIFGTPEYMSPEQVRGDEIDARADVYAAGAILFELLTGRPPFRASTGVQTMTAQVAEPPPQPSLVAPNRAISSALDAVVLHALAKAPDDRYQSAGDMRAALERALATPDGPESVHPKSVRPPAPSGRELPPQSSTRSRPVVPREQGPHPTPIDPLATTVDVAMLMATEASVTTRGTPARPPSAPPSIGVITPDAIDHAGASGARRYLGLIIAAVAIAVGVLVGLTITR